MAKLAVTHVETHVATPGESQAAYGAKGNDANVASEGDLRVRTGMALKQLYKPVIKRALKRGHMLKWNHFQHRRRFKDLGSGVFICLRRLLTP